MVKFNRATIDNLEELYNLEQTIFNKETKESLLHALNADCYVYYLAKINDELVGYIALNLILPDAELLYIAVKESERGKQIGKSLIEFACQELAKLNASQIFLEVARSNLIAYNLYKKMGFYEISIRKNYYSLGGGKSEDAIIMKKDL